MRLFYATLVIASLLTACSNQPPLIVDSAPSVHPANIENTPDAIPKFEAKSRGGNPSSYEVFGKTYYVLPSSDGFVQTGTASWYGTKFHGNKTSNGEIYDMYAMTAAHKTLPIPTYVEVKNLSNGKKIIVRVNDRGPFHDNRIIDLSYAAAAKLGALKNGTSHVEIKAINPRSQSPVTLDLPPNFLKQQQKVAQRTNPLIPTPKTNNKGFLFIQIGAFQSLENATQLKRKITNELKTPVVVKSSSANQTPLYLVRVGPYIRMKKADLARLQLQEFGFKNIIYITE